MCLIIDVNVAHKILLSNNDPDFKDVHECLFTNKKPAVRIMYSAQLLDECKNTGVRRILVELDRAGRARRASEKEVEQN